MMRWEINPSKIKIENKFLSVNMGSGYNAELLLVASKLAESDALLPELPDFNDAIVDAPKAIRQPETTTIQTVTLPVPVPIEKSKPVPDWLLPFVLIFLSLVYLLTVAALIKLYRDAQNMRSKSYSTAKTQPLKVKQLRK